MQYKYLSNGQYWTLPGSKGGLKSRVGVVDHFIVFEKESAPGVWENCGGYGDPGDEVVVGGRIRFGVRDCDWCDDIELTPTGFDGTESSPGTSDGDWKCVGSIVWNNYVEYPAVGDVIEMSHGVTYSGEKFKIPSGVLTFYFVDNGLDMTAFFNGIVWVFFYVNYAKHYNWYAIDPARTGDNSFTSSDDWAVATSANFDTLLTYLGTLGITNTSVANGAGNHLKSRRQTDTPLNAPFATATNPYWAANATHICLDTFKLGCAANGTRSGSTGVFGNITLRGYIITSTLVGSDCTIKWLRNSDGRLQTVNAAKSNSGSVQLVRTATVAEQLEDDGTIVDSYFQNNGYPIKAVKIGTQVWTSQVFETEWRDNSEIPHGGVNPLLYSDAEWAALVTPAVCDYSSNVHNSFYLTYSPLFTKYANNPIITKGLAGSWESTGIRDPILLVDSSGNMVMEGGKYIMYYNGRDPGIGAGERTRVGRATSTDLINWTKEATNPIHSDGLYAGAGSVIKRGEGDYIMYYHYEAATKFNYATSTDGLIWVKNEVGNPILDITDVTDSVTIGLPNVVEINGTQYMVFEGYIDNWRVCMAKSIDWVTWEYVGVVYTSQAGYWDYQVQANPSLYKVAENYYIIIYNGQLTLETDGFHLGILHSNSIESGWKRLQDMPVLLNGADGAWDDTRIEGGRVYRDKINTARFKLFYFGLPTADSFNDGAIGCATIKSGVTFEYKVV